MTPSIRLICPYDAHHRKRTEAPRQLILRGPSPDHPNQKYRSLSEIIANTPHVTFTSGACDDSDEDGDYSDVLCEECHSGEGGGKMLLCDKCDRGFHIFCLRPIIVRVPTGPWFCPSCSNQKPPRVLRLSQTKIIDFFRIQKQESPTEKFPIDLRKRRRRSGQLVVSKKKRRLLPFVPSAEPDKRLEQMRSLAVALKALKMQFSDELTYVPGMAPRSANAAKLEKGGMQVICSMVCQPEVCELEIERASGVELHSEFLRVKSHPSFSWSAGLESLSTLVAQVLSKEDTQTLEQCKAMYKRGEVPPLLVTFDRFEGFTVEADAHIKDLTIITEYVGDVDYLTNRENDDCDSMMTLLSADNPSDSLVICPDQRGNIARFINGINNHTPDGRKKQNLKCVRYSVDGECRVLIVANRDIAKGERMYYDYNGYEHEYPTEHFI